MPDVIQIAFQIDSHIVVELDAVAADASSSRAEVVRQAVREFLARRREASIDAQLAAGYGLVPPGAEEDGFAAVSLAGFQASDLDW
ncbi:MAG: ribbon-helix-helix protein, CopG family [Sporichthyaceae bacterium]